MDNFFEFAIGAAHQTLTPEDMPTSRMAHSNVTGHGHGIEDRQGGYVNEVFQCPRCDRIKHGY